MAIDVKRRFPEMKWEKNEKIAPYQLDMSKRSDLLAKKRFEAAKKVSEVDYNFEKHLLPKNKMVFSTNCSPEDIENKAVSKNLIKLYEGCKLILKDLQSKSADEINAKNMPLLRKQIHKLLELAKKVIDQEDSDFKDCRKFLNHLSYLINTQAEGMGVFEEIGGALLKAHAEQRKTQLNDPDLYNKMMKKEFDETPVSLKELSKWTKEIFSQMKADNWETFTGKLIWTVKNLMKSLLALMDNFIPGGYKRYIAYKLGNENMWIGDFKVKDVNNNDRTIHFNLGPSVASDPLFKAQLEYQKNEGMQHLQHTLESKSKKGEKARLISQRDLATSKPDTFKLIGSTLDGDIREGKDKFADIKSVKGFHESLKELMEGQEKMPVDMKEYKGFATGLTNEEMDETLNASQAALQAIFGKGTFASSDEETNARLSRAMNLVVTGFLDIKYLIKFGANGNTKNATMGQACKQDFDRGPSVNADTIIFVQLINNGGLKWKDAKQLIGILMRALTVDGRLMNRDRLEGWIDLLRIIGSNEKAFVEQLQSFAGKTTENPNPITFTPSNKV